MAKPTRIQQLIKIIEKAKVVGKIDLPKEPTKSNKDGKDEVTKKELDELEKVLDKMFASIDVDIEFTRHFLDRVNDKRNKKPITIDELRDLFKKTYTKYKNDLKTSAPDFQAVLLDVQKNINLPFVLVYDKKNSEMDLIAKTVMRKKGFKSSNKFLKV